MSTYLYNVGLNWKSHRRGEISSPQLNQKIEVATPPEFANGISGIWSPEHLFTAAVSSCFMTTFLAIAENSKLEFISLSCPATGKLDLVEGKFLMSEILLEPVLTIPYDTDLEKAEKILIKSERACLISNSITSVIILKPNVIIEKILAL